LSAFLDAGVKQHYGNRAEKLAEFGLQPLRRRPRAQQTEPVGAPVEPPATPEE